MNRSRALLVAGLAVSALFLWLALREIDLTELAAALGRTNGWWVVPYLLCLFCFCWLKSMRWAHLLQPVASTSARDLLAPIVVGYMGTGLMPMQLGEVVRAYLAALRLRSKLSPVLASLLIERVLDVFVLLLIVGLIGLTRSDLAVQYRAAGALFLGIALTTLTAMWIYAAYTDRFVDLVRRCTAALPPKWQGHLLEQVQAGAAGAQVLRRPTTYLGLTILSIAQWACICACVWISLAAVGQWLSPIAALAVLATTMLAMTLPSGPGYIGTLQLAFVLALAPFGVDGSDAVAASVFYLASLWIPLVGGGLILLHRMGLGLGDLSRNELQRESP